MCFCHVFCHVFCHGFLPCFLSKFSHAFLPCDVFCAMCFAMFSMFCHVLNFSMSSFHVLPCFLRLPMVWQCVCHVFAMCVCAIFSIFLGFCHVFHGFPCFPCFPSMLPCFLCLPMLFCHVFCHIFFAMVSFHVCLPGDRSGEVLQEVQRAVAKQTEN